MSQNVVSLDSLAIGMPGAEQKLTFDVAPLRGKPKPPRRLGAVHRYPVAGLVQTSEHHLTLGVALLGSESIPAGSLGMCFRYTRAGLVHPAQLTLAAGVTARGRESKPPQRLGVILMHTVALAIRNAEQPLSYLVALLGCFPNRGHNRTPQIAKPFRHSANPPSDTGDHVCSHTIGHNTRPRQHHRSHQDAHLRFQLLWPDLGTRAAASPTPTETESPTRSPSPTLHGSTKPRWIS